MRSSVTLVAAVLVGLPTVAEAAPYQRPGRTERVSVASDGSEGNADSSFTVPRLSSDGRFVAFGSAASNLVPGDANGVSDVFVRDRVRGTTERVSTAADGSEGNASSGNPAISADGRLVAFHSNASNLVPGDTNGRQDIFVKDRETGEVRLVSVRPDGTPPSAASSFPAISADGSRVAFHSDAADLVPGDTNGRRDVFVHDLKSGETVRASVTNDGGQGTSDTRDIPDISGDGRFVVFTSGSQLTTEDTNNRLDVFVRDIETGRTELASISTDGKIQKENTAGSPSISADGRYVTFDSASWNMVPLDTNGDLGPIFDTFMMGFDVYVRDRKLGVTEEVSVTPAGVEVDRDSGYSDISGDGRFVVFLSAGDLVTGERSPSGMYLHDRLTGVTERVAVGIDGSPSTGGTPTISADGRSIAFQSSATNLVADDTNGKIDIFVRERGPSTGTLWLEAEAEDGGIRARAALGLGGLTVSTAQDAAGDVPPGVAELGADLVGASLIHRAEQDDLLLRLPVTAIPEVRDPRLDAGSSGTMGVVHGLDLTVDGVRFEVRASQRGAAISPRQMNPLDG
ncbi:MAG TPA: hypothetical protein VM638_07735, partial [Actinomycetota bacterium]|nr:hypothetical protein [Actinomycetota bacterium]